MPLGRVTAAVFALGLCLIGVGTVVARSRADASQDRPPTFRAGVQYIEVDVRITDRDGNAVRDLTKEDFTLLDDGVPQAITSAAFVDLSVESPVTRRRAGTIEPDVATNAGSGRMWVMLLGEFSLRARFVARQFVEQALGPNDEVAVVHVHGLMSAAQGFTRNRSLMLSAIDRLRPDPEFNPTRTAFTVLEEICLRLGRLGGGRKTVLFFDPPSVFIPSFAESSAYFDQRDALRAATRNNVAVYVVSTGGMSTELGNLEFLAGLRVLAEETGGDAIVNSNNFEDGYQRFVRDTNQYYLLGFTPSVEHSDEKFHRLTVRVNRPGFSVHARQGYYGSKTESVTKPENPPEPDAPGLSPEAMEALRLPLSVSGLTIDLAAAPFRGPTGNGSVLLSARVRGDALVLGAGESIEVGYRATTTEGKTTPGAFHVIKLDLTDRSRAAAKASGLQFVDWMAMPAGRHQIRFVVNQPNGKTGMVVGDVDVPDFKAAVSMSGLVIGSARLSAQPTMKPPGLDDPMQKLLRAQPTAERTFDRSDMLTTYAEVYTSGKTPPPSLKATIARVAQSSRPQTIDVVLLPAEPGKQGVMARIPLRELRPGDYVLTLEAKAGRESTSRQVLFSVTDR